MMPGSYKEVRQSTNALDYAARQDGNTYYASQYQAPSYNIPVRTADPTGYAGFPGITSTPEGPVVNGACPDICVCAPLGNGQNLILDCILPDGCVERGSQVDCSAAGGGVYGYKESRRVPPVVWQGGIGDLNADLQACIDQKLDECGYGAYKSLISRYKTALRIDPNTFCEGMDCDACAEAFWGYVQNRVRLAPWIGGSLEQCFSDPGNPGTPSSFGGSYNFQPRY